MGVFRGVLQIPFGGLGKKVCLPIEMGGLGIRNVVSFNQVLLGKWQWRYVHEVTHLWQRVISTKYGEGQGGGVLKYVGGLMDVVYGEVVIKGGRAFLSICCL